MIRKLKNLHGKITSGERKPWEVWLWLLVAAVAAELFLFNFPAWESRRNADTAELGEIRVEGGTNTGSGEDGRPVYMVDEGVL